MGLKKSQVTDEVVAHIYGVVHKEVWDTIIPWSVIDTDSHMNRLIWHSKENDYVVSEGRCHEIYQYCRVPMQNGQFSFQKLKYNRNTEDNCTKY